ncbi:MAG: LUD domain-containing protein [Bacteroidales bacterium]|jgi:L-lactate dehydrogenase complex protein LldG|nr:LUD domain-containing protein [Bacteroidales bacterium]
MNFPFGYNKDCTNKEQILAKVRSAILEKDENHFSDINLQDDTWVPFKEDDGNEFTFIERFKGNGGIFMYFEEVEHFKEAMQQFVVENNWNPLLTTSPLIKEIFADTDITFYDDYNNLERKKNVSIIDCECLIAQTGSILVSEATAGSRAAYSCADTLLVLARPSQFVAKMKDAFAFMRAKYGDNQPSGMTIISGASRSTDIGNTLVMGAFGCKQIALFLVE